MEESGPAAVLVVGAGPVGLAAAIELVRLGIHVRVVEKRPAPSARSKAIGVNPRTLELLESSGVSRQIINSGRRILGMRLYDGGRRRLEIAFEDIDHRYNTMIALPQAETEAVLGRRLAELGVRVEREKELTGIAQGADDVTATVRRLPTGTDETVAARLLIGCDGAHSTVRHLLGIGFPGEAMDGDWSLADVRVDQGLDPHHAAVRCGPDGMLFSIAFGEGVFRVASDRPGVLGRLPPGTEVREVLWKANFTVSHRQAERYAEGRVFLAGDAAHVHSPVGARGMNMGIEDAVLLARMIAGGGTARYHRERHAFGARTIRLVRAQTRLATAGGWVARRLRRTVLPVVLAFPPTRRKVLRKMVGLA